MPDLVLKKQVEAELAATKETELQLPLSPAADDEPDSPKSQKKELATKVVSSKSSVKRTTRQSAAEIERDLLKKELETLKREKEEKNAGASPLDELNKNFNLFLSKMAPAPAQREQNACDKADIPLAMSSIGYQDWCPSIWPTAAQLDFFKQKLKSGSAGFIAVDLRTPLWWPVGHEKVAEAPALSLSANDTPTFQSLSDELNLVSTAKKEQIKNANGYSIFSPT